MHRRPTRRTTLTGAALAATVTAVGLPSAYGGGDPASQEPGAGSPATKSAPTADGARAASDWGPEETHPWDRPRASGRPLRRTSPQAAGLDGEVLDRLPGIIREGLEHDPPRYSAASMLVASQAGIAYEHADGHALRWKDDEEQLPSDQWVPARDDTIYDIASISKIFTATAVMQLVEQGELGLQDTVATHLPRFAEGGKEEVTVTHLLTHVGGLPPFVNLWSEYPDIPSRIDAALTVEPTSAPDTEYVYSDLGLIALGLIVEKLSGLGLDEYVHEHITAPLGMDETMYNPPSELLERIAATEYMEATGELVRGHVHDENAHSLGGVAGHAGVFSTAGDLAIFGQMFLGGGRYGKARVLEAETVREMFSDHIGQITGVGGERRGLGPELEAWFYHAGLTSPYSGTHTGFTGTSMVIDPLTDTVVILLTNSVHPTREWSTTSVTRRAVSTCVAEALGLVPEQVRDGWHAGHEDDTAATLSVAVDIGADDSAGDGSGADGSGGDGGGADGSGGDDSGADGGGQGSGGRSANDQSEDEQDHDDAPRLELELFTHLETAYDLLILEATADGGSTWIPLTGQLTSDDREPIEVPEGQITGWGGRCAWRGVFPLVDDGAPLTGEVELRATVTTDAQVRGLGTWIGRIRVEDGGQVLLDTDRPEDAEQVEADGWVRAD